MTDREKIVKGLEYHLKELSVGKTCYECPYCGDNPCEIHLISDALTLLMEQTAVSTTWVCHLYRSGDKRFECSWCHGTSWKPSDYCPDCGTRMAEVVNMDD